MNHWLCAKRRILLALVCCTHFALQAAVVLASTEIATVRYGDREQKQIAITIDDCYDTDHVLAAIELCEEFEIPVTFFPIGNALKYADGELWQRAIDVGCEIGNHSWGHKDLTGLSDRQIRFQMLRTQQKLDGMLGYHYPMQVMRPPYGTTSKRVSTAVASVGYLSVVKWDVSQTDAGKAFHDVQSGSILLYHARSKDIRCLKELVPRLLEQGYECVTVSELLGFDAIVPSEEIYIYEKEHATDPSLLKEYGETLKNGITSYPSRYNHLQRRNITYVDLKIHLETLSRRCLRAGLPADFRGSARRGCKKGDSRLLHAHFAGLGRNQ